ncbi:HAMP domain-containing histidine kinase [bacterium SCSIO 12741]|nr:HAMP domain-containing histidine kinase [bacterium SCSIO 12741]
MILLILSSFLIIGAITIWYTKEENEKYHNQRLMRKERAVMASLSYYLIEKEGDNQIFYTDDFQRKLLEISDVHSLEISLYDLDGNWIASSDRSGHTLSHPHPSLEKEILSELALSGGDFISSKTVHGEIYLTALRYLRSNSEKPLAIINIPYYSDQQHTREETQDFLWALAQVYALLLVLGLIIAYVLSNSITKSLQAIQQRIRSISLSGKNEELEYAGNDEIAALVNEYNKKVRELEESAEKLAQKEREGAWREMARQVAHEIKNPLTPMKLSVQQLEKSWKDGREDYGDRLSRFTQMMTEQIDTLAHIASEFSDFAQLPRAQAEVFDPVKEATQILNLFRKEGGAELTLNNTLVPESRINMDRNHFKRVLTNLVTNSIQAFEDEEKGKIELAFTLENEDRLLLTVKDNGGGIPEDLQPRIFQPNFTTKSGGAGLGLSMVRSMVENAEGDIRVESSVTSGTTFFISLPLH